VSGARVEDPHGLLEEAFGLGEGVVPAGLAMGELREARALASSPLWGVVVGQDLDPLVEPVGVEGFDGFPGGGVVGLAPWPHQCLVDGFLGEDVLEGVLALRRQGALVDEVEVFKLEQGPFEFFPLQPATAPRSEKLKTRPSTEATCSKLRSSGSSRRPGPGTAPRRWWAS